MDEHLRFLAKLLYGESMTYDCREFRISRKTASKLATALGLSEAQVVHVALANLARQTLPRHEADNGPLTPAHFAAIDKVVPQGRLRVANQLI